MTIFLKAEWRHLLMINYEIDPNALAPFIPKGTDLDLWNGKAYISLVGFMFLNTSIKGISIPFHTHFEEVNLRFYIKRHCPEGIRRGVAFIKEIVPRWAIAFVARRLYGENYFAHPMRHLILDNPKTVEYQWKSDGKWQKLKATAQGNLEIPSKGSQAEFITEHYWGYSIQPNGETLEYQVKHPPWLIQNVAHCDVDIDMKAIYGPLFAPFLEKPPSSAFLAEGSEVIVYKGNLVKV